MASTRRGAMRSRPALASTASRGRNEPYPMSTVGCSSFRPATRRGNDWLTGNRMRGARGLENVRLSAAEMCVGFDAAIAAVTRGTPRNVGSFAQSRYWKRTSEVHSSAQARHPWTNTPRCPLDPPDATTWYSPAR